jgi:hypothetical protein
MPCRYRGAVRPLLVATSLALCLLAPAVARGVVDGGGVTAPAPVRETHRSGPHRAPGDRGELRVVRGPAPQGAGLRLLVAVEGRLRVDPSGFAQTVARTLEDRRGWWARGYRFRLVASAPGDVEVVLASPALTDRLCAPLPTLGRYSCAQGSRAVLNFRRWRDGASPYASLERYRTYMINHEVGHVLGRGHAYCSGPGAAAPVMVQQTKGVAPCRPNPWPLESE